MITYIFFELPGVIIDPAAMYAQLPMHVGQFMSERYGQPPEIWEQAFRQVRVDWDSYWADLNLSGDEPLAEFWEGMFRISRALFRQVDIAQPTKRELITISRLFPELVLMKVDALYPNTRSLLQKLRETGLCLHAVTYLPSSFARAVLIGGGVFEYFCNRVTGIDVTGRFDYDYAQLATSVRTPPENCLLVDRDRSALVRARAAGMQTARAGTDIDLPQLLTRLTIERL